MDALRVSVDRPGTPAGKTALSEVGRRHIVGLEATLFSEIMHTQDQIDYLLMPRMLGLAERAWSPDPAWAREADPAKAQALHAQAWSIFTHHLGTRVLPRLSLEMPSLRWRIPAPGLRRQGEWVQVNVQLPGLDVRYTTDGSDPTWASERVSGPIRAVQPVRAATFAPDGRRSAVSFTGPQ
jgi:hexosaminidase